MTRFDGSFFGAAREDRRPSFVCIYDQAEDGASTHIVRPTYLRGEQLDLMTAGQRGSRISCEGEELSKIHSPVGEVDPIRGGMVSRVTRHPEECLWRDTIQRAAPLSG